jgi:ribonuclease P protein subunit POP4
MRKKLGRDYSFLLEELIGLEVIVQKASSKALQGLEGRILDESKNTFLLETSRGRKRIPKATCTFLFIPQNKEVDGKLLVARPEDRTKKLSKELHSS